MTVAVPRVNLFVTNFSMKRTLALSLDLKICDALGKKKGQNDVLSTLTASSQCCNASF